MADLVRPDPRVHVSVRKPMSARVHPSDHHTYWLALSGLRGQNGRIFNGPDGYQYRWRPANNSHHDEVVSKYSTSICGRHTHRLYGVADRNGGAHREREADRSSAPSCKTRTAT